MLKTGVDQIGSKFVLMDSFCVQGNESRDLLAV